ncbi:MAG: HK97 family phage prohead protease [Proteobacteria bacterium]|nr:HK97 family phage prohead protease [Pseudomonadota bacterium]
MDRLYIETKMVSDEAGAISGLAWKFGVPDRVGDDILPGAFKGVKLPVPMLFGHDMNDPIGTWDVATEKSDGLHLTGKMLVEEVARAREIHALVQSGAVRGLSIGFIIKSSSPRVGGGRTIKSLELLEVSLVTVGMHPGAKVTSAKSAVQAMNLAAAINRAAAQIGRN